MKKSMLILSTFIASNLLFFSCNSESSKQDEAAKALGIPEGGFTSEEDVQKASQGMMDNLKSNMANPLANETYDKIDFRLGRKIEVPNSALWERDGNEWHNEKMDATIFIQDLALSGDFTSQENLDQLTNTVLEANRRDAPKFEDIKHIVEKRGKNVLVNFMGKFDNGTSYVTKDLALTSKTQGSVAIMGRAKAQNAAYIMSLVEYMAASNLNK